jgi:ABC-type phosphate transport system ATPase subunit
MSRTAEKPFSLRLSPDLVARVDECAERLRATGLSVSRTDVARMLIARALDVMGYDPKILLSTEPILPSR